VLTSLVITFGVSAFLMALIFRSWRLADVDEVRDDDTDIALGRAQHEEFDEFEDAGADSGDDTEFGTRAEAAVSGAAVLDDEHDPQPAPGEGGAS
jgi:hypothetical protein